MSTYLSIVLREGLARFAAAYPSLDWQVETPALRAALNDLNLVYARWFADPRCTEREVHAAYQAYKAALLAANHLQFDLFAERKAG